MPYDNKWRIPDKPLYGLEKVNTTTYDVNTFQYYMTFLTNIALSRFKYTGLPKEIRPLAIEEKLLYEGCCIIFKDDVTNMFAVTSVNLSGDMDIYHIPEDRQAISLQYTKFYDKNNSVLMWGRALPIPEILQIEYHAKTLSDMKVSRDMNILQQRVPIALEGNNDTQLDQDNFIKKILMGIPFFRARKGFKEAMGINAIDLKVAPIFKDLDVTITREISMCLNELGIEAYGHEKAERMISSETSSNDGMIEMARYSCLDQRERAIKALNEMYGINAKVEFNSSLITNVNAPEKNTGIEGGE